MNKDTVNTHGENFNAKFLKFAVFFCDRRNLCCSDKSKVTGIEAEDHPLPQVF